MAEVQLGMLASERGTNPDVKAFGRMMVKDHSQANKELAQTAAQLKVQPPKELDAKHRDLANRLSKLQGGEFDREYMTAMVQGHEEVLKQLRAFTGNQLTTNAPAERPAGRATAGQGGANECTARDRICGHWHHGRDPGRTGTDPVGKQNLACGSTAPGTRAIDRGGAEVITCDCTSVLPRGARAYHRANGAVTRSMSADYPAAIVIGRDAIR